MAWKDMADRMLGVSVRTFSHVSNNESLVQYIPKTGLPYTIRAVFDAAHVEVDPSTGAQVGSTNPILGVQLSQMQAEPRNGDRANIDGVMYSVDGFQPDGVAGAMLELHKV